MVDESEVFASETIQDSGLDSDTGIYINGGIAVGTGKQEQ